MDGIFGKFTAFFGRTIEIRSSFPDDFWRFRGSFCLWPLLAFPQFAHEYFYGDRKYIGVASQDVLDLSNGFAGFLGRAQIDGQAFFAYTEREAM